MKSKKVAIRKRDGQITGWVTVYWCAQIKRWVTIPDAE